MRIITILVVLAIVAPLPARAAGAETSPATTVRTEAFPRPPYSEATYYIYERDGRTVCTKLAVCNKYDQCRTQYIPGAFREAEDTSADGPSGTPPAVAIAVASLPKHVCLTRFGLAGGQ